MSIFRTVLTSVLVVSLIAGCTYVPTRSLEYEPIPIAVRRPPASVLVVRDLEEGRGERYYASSLGRMFLTYVPLIPYVKIPYERLDESDQRHRNQRRGPAGGDSHFTIAMTKAIADDLGASRLFREVRYIGSDPVPADADYVIEGRLESTEFDVYATSYMLGMAGVLLWLLPIPIGKNAAQVKADLRLRDRSGREVWSGQLTGSGSRVFTFYNSSGAAVTNPMMLEIKRYAGNDEGIDGDSLWAYHASALRIGMADIKRSLASSLEAEEWGEREIGSHASPASP